MARTSYGRNVRQYVVSYDQCKDFNSVIEQHEAIKAVIASFAKLHSVLDFFQRSLYHQKHAFYFRKVKKWVACVRVSYEVMPSSATHTSFVQNGLPKLLGMIDNYSIPAS